MRQSFPSVLFVAPAKVFGGHEVMLLRWLVELAAQRLARPILVCREAGALQRRAAECGIETVTFGEFAPIAARGGKLAKVGELIPTLVAVQRAVWKHRPRYAVLSEGGLNSQPMAMVALRLTGLRTFVYCPLVSSYEAMGHDDPAGAAARFRRLHAKLPAGWITLSGEQAADFEAWSGVRQPMHVLPNTVESRYLDQRDVHRERTFRGSSIRALVLGRVEDRHKGTDLLLHHLRAHSAEHAAAGIEVSIVGDGPSRAAIEGLLAADASLREVLAVRGWMDPMSAFAEADCLLLVSRYEGIPLVMLEAIALGIPVVASDLPGTRPFVHPACSFAVGDLAGAFRALVALRDEGHRRDVLELQARRFDAQCSREAFAAAVKRLHADLSA